MKNIINTFKNRYAHNMSNIESNLRLLLATSLMVVAVSNESYILMLISMIIAYTGSTKFCFVYKVLDINKKLSLKNYYLSHLAKYNPSAIFMFYKHGEIFFENLIATKDFAHIKNINDFNLGDIHEITMNEITDTVFYDFEDKNYQINFKGIADIDAVVVYAVDITEVVALNKEIEKTQEDVIYKLGEIGESRSKETGQHVKRVAEYSALLGELYGLSREEYTMLKIASPMHDIGKIAIADEILNKPAKFTQEEFEIMKNHATYGYEMLKNSNRPIIKAAATIAFTHHEKYDGSGYPLGIAGEDIDIFGRITAVADVFDALYSVRVYKKAWSLEEVLEYFRTESGKHFDPKLVSLFLENIEQFLEIFEKYKDN